MGLLKELKQSVKNFTLAEAEELSDRIHGMERNGYVLNPVEELWWGLLTGRIYHAKK